MKHLRCLARAYYRHLLTFVLAALAVQAFVPTGLMIAPAAGGGAQIILCPQTHPLARAAAAKATAEMVAMHAAMGHGTVDHAAMGHGPASPDDSAPASSAPSGGQTCAFAGAGALALLLPDLTADFFTLTAPIAQAAVPLKIVRLAWLRYLRPPLRAPPALI